MPLVRVDVTGPKPTAWKAAVMRGVRTAIVEGAGAPDEHVSVRIIEASASSVDIPQGRADGFIYLEVAWFAGRTEEQKRAVVSLLREALAADPGLAPADVNVGFIDFPRTDLYV